MTNRSGAAVALVLLVTLSATFVAPFSAVGPAAAQQATVEGEPDLDALAPDNVLTPGETTQLTVQITNDGEVTESGPNATAASERAVTTARNVVATLEAGDAPLDVRTGSTAVGDLADGAVTTVTFTVVVDQDASPGTYDLPVELAYDYTSETGGNETNTESRTEEETVEVEITDRPRFEVTDVDSDVQVGDEGTVALTLEHVGEEPVTDATVTLTSTSPDLRFGRAVNATRFVGEWDPGEERTVEYRVTASNDTSVEEYPLRAVVSYTDESGSAGQSRPLTVGVTPRGEQTFTVEDVGGTLRVDAEGTIEGTLVNEGPGDVTNAVVRVRTGSGNVRPVDPEVVVGDLDAGDGAEFEVPTLVTRDARPGRVAVTFDVVYENAEGETRRSESLRSTVAVDEEEPPFTLEDVDSNVQVGDDGTVTVTLENAYGEPVTDATVTLTSTNPDLRVGAGANASRFVGEWDDGEERAVTFDVRATNGTAVEEYPLVARVSFDDEDGTARRSGPISFGVTPGEEQTFAVANVDSDLRVNADGTLSATVENEGPGDVTNAVIQIASGTGSLAPTETEVVVGDLDAGAAERFEFPFSVPASAEPGDRQVSFVVQYDNAEGDTRRSDPLRTPVAVGPERTEVELVDVDSDLQVGERGTVTVTLENARRQSLSNARVSLASTSANLLVGGAANASRFVGEWDSDEQQTVTFDATVVNDSDASSYPLTARVTYEDADGDTHRPDPARFGVTPAGEQSFAVRVTDSDLAVGEDGTVSGVVTNEGPRRVEAAVVRIGDAGANVRPEETEYPLGILDPDENATFSFPVDVSPDAQAGPRALSFRVVYQNADDESRRSNALQATVRVAADPEAFRLERTDANLQVGTDGNVTVAVRNTGNETLRDATISLASTGGDITLGGVGNASRYVGSWEPGAVETVTFEANAPASTGVQRYPFRARVAYEEPDGDQARSDPLVFGVEPSPEQSFAVPRLSATLRVGEEGTVEGTVENRGPGPARDAVVRLTAGSERIVAQESTSALGTLRAGENATFSFPVEVTEEAETGDRQLSFVVEYQNRDGETVESDAIGRRVSIGERRTRFVVRPNATDVDAGGTATVTINVTNNGDDRVTEIDAKVFVDDPLSADDDTAFVSALDPGETASIQFEMSASGGASPKQYPASVDFQYDTPDDETKLSEAYRFPVDVVQPPDEGLPVVFLVAGALLVLLVLAWVVLRR